MTNGLVSIIMPSFNCGQYIEETVSSVRNQTYQDWELIFFFVFSKEDSLKIIKKIAIMNKTIFKREKTFLKIKESVV